ncbi:hypothetical protein N7520_008765 [Penicillium odoratum]|uniref:uncharacterized protein n=1 Tax=Penicillium odoratum TaxID=1167516 RepID=UPI002546C98F|nr:uncharacterized protein N7520_008765 [Penicillium odoratum]KAJ5751848.1 hypothetical protein N7520_008765 [Penicillium odoratum]
MAESSKTSTPSKKNLNAQDDLLGMTPAEIRLLFLAWVYTGQDGKIDIEPVAQLANFTVGSARTLIGKAKRKLTKNLEDGMGPPASMGKTTPSKTPATPSKVASTKPAAKRGRKRKAESEDEAEPEHSSEPENEYAPTFQVQVLESEPVERECESAQEGTEEYQNEADEAGEA